MADGATSVAGASARTNHSMAPSYRLLQKLTVAVADVVFGSLGATPSRRGVHARRTARGPKGALEPSPDAVGVGIGGRATAPRAPGVLVVPGATKTVTWASLRRGATP